MTLFGANLGRFLRVVGLVTLTGLAGVGCSSDEGDVLPSVSTSGPSGLSPAEWGARLFQDRGCTGCHQLSTSGVRTLANKVSRTVEQPEEPETDVEDATPTEALVVVHDEQWATDLLLQDAHGSSDARVRLTLARREARALAAFLATCR